MSEELRAALQHDDPAARARALSCIDGPPRPGAGALVFEALGDEDPTVRKEAVRLAERWRSSPEVVAALERALRDVDSLSRRSSAMDAFGLLGRDAVSPLARLLRDENPGIRRLAVDALGLTRAREAAPWLVNAARDPVASIRAAALEALQRIGAPEAGRVLIDVIGAPDESPAVVLAALLGLVASGETVAAPLLERHLADALTAPPALRLLGRAGDAERLVRVIVSGTGSRQRAAVLGLQDALEREPTRARALDVVGAAELSRVLGGLIDRGDAHVGSAALAVGARAGLVELFGRAASRPDRHALAPAAHRAAAALVDAREDAALSLDALAKRDPDAPGADLLNELADAARRRRALAASRSDRRAGHALDVLHLTDAGLARLAALLEATAGILVAADARERLESRLLSRVEATGTGSFDAYVDLIAQGTAEARRELQRALELVTVHETYFFRERAQLDAFRDEVLPRAAGRRQAEAATSRDRTLRVWSAGTSSGEEAWTLAMILEDSGLFSGALSYEVVGTDLSETAISQARTGRYSPKSFRGDIDPAVRKRRFVYELGGVSVDRSVRPYVRFEVVNLLDDEAVAKLPRFDVIFCRNVLIYMSKEARMRVVERFYERLVPGGVLFLGHSESLLHVETRFRLLPLARELCWARPEADEGWPPPLRRRDARARGGS